MTLSVLSIPAILVLAVSSFACARASDPQDQTERPMRDVRADGPTETTGTSTGRGEVYFEGHGTVHWVENVPEQPATTIAVDIVASDQQ